MPISCLGQITVTEWKSYWHHNHRSGSCLVSILARSTPFWCLQVANAFAFVFGSEYGVCPWLQHGSLQLMNWTVLTVSRGIGHCNIGKTKHFIEYFIGNWDFDWRKQLVVYKSLVDIIPRLKVKTLHIFKKNLITSWRGASPHLKRSNSNFTCKVFLMAMNILHFVAITIINEVACTHCSQGNSKLWPNSRASWKLKSSQVAFNHWIGKLQSEPQALKPKVSDYII